MVEVGNTPWVEIDGIYAKMEGCNPWGSIKDRMAVYVIDESERQGLLRKGMTIVEATSGNTGIALASYALIKNYNMIAVMPSDMTRERKDKIRNLGATLVLVNPGDFCGAAAERDKIVSEDPSRYFSTNQFGNPLNVECHYKTTGPEILSNVNGQGIDAFVAGIGTGGTLIGVGKALRERYPKVHLVAVEPLESAVMGGGQPGTHRISGIGDGFIPEIASNGNGGINLYINEVIAVSTEEAEEAAHYILKRGLCGGVSSGANLVAAKRLKERFNTVVTVFPDGCARYLSRGLRHPEGTCPYQVHE